MLFLNMNEAAGWYSYIEKKDNKKMAIDGDTWVALAIHSLAFLKRKKK